MTPFLADVIIRGRVARFRSRQTSPLKEGSLRLSHVRHDYKLWTTARFVICYSFANRMNECFHPCRPVQDGSNHCGAHCRVSQPYLAARPSRQVHDTVRRALVYVHHQGSPRPLAEASQGRAAGSKSGDLLKAALQFPAFRKCCVRRQSRSALGTCAHARACAAVRTRAELGLRVRVSAMN